MKKPGPSHPIEIAANGDRLRAYANGAVIADSQNVLTLQEANYPPVHYFPRADIVSGVLDPTHYQTYCPYKGEADYFNISLDGALLENAAWCYSEPYPHVSQIQGHVAFYTDRIDVVAVSED